MKNILQILLFFLIGFILFSCDIFDNNRTEILYDDFGGEFDFIATEYKWNKTTLTFYFDASISDSEFKNAVKKAIKTWDDVIPLSINETASLINADIIIGIGGISHLGCPKDFTENTLAHGCPPNFETFGSFAGDLHFNNKWLWSVTDNPSSAQKDIETVALHEFGHVLGLGHSTEKSNIMYFSYLNIQRSLSLDDIKGIQSLYGSTSVTEESTISLSGNINFGTVIVYSSNTQTLTVTNSGTKSLNITSITLPNGFSGNWNGNVAPNSSQPITIYFNPTIVGTYSGTLTVNSNATKGVNSVNITGAAVSVNVPDTRIIGLTSIDFGQVNVGSYLDKNFTITNSGNAILSISSINLPNGFSINGSQTLSIQPGSSGSVSLRFSPTNAANYQGNILINSNATAGTSTTTISGIGVATALRYTCAPSIDVYTSNSNMIMLKVKSVTETDITFRMQKSTGTFSHTGNLYIREGSTSGAIVKGPVPYNIGWSYLDNVTITNNITKGNSKKYFAEIRSATTDVYFSGAITIKCE